MCEWCGHVHDVKALCSKRPRWGRRGFIAFAGAALLGLAADPQILLPRPEEVWFTLTLDSVAQFANAVFNNQPGTEGKLVALLRGVERKQMIVDPPEQVFRQVHIRKDLADQLLFTP